MVAAQRPLWQTAAPASCRMQPSARQLGGHAGIGGQTRWVGAGRRGGTRRHRNRGADRLSPGRVTYKNRQPDPHSDHLHRSLHAALSAERTGRLSRNRHSWSVTSDARRSPERTVHCARRRTITVGVRDAVIWLSTTVFSVDARDKIEGRQCAVGGHDRLVVSGRSVLCGSSRMNCS